MELKVLLPHRRGQVSLHMALSVEA